MKKNILIPSSFGTALRLTVACLAVSWVLPTQSFAQLQDGSDGKWVINPKHVGASVDFGAIQKGNIANEVENFAITRTGVYMNASGTYEDKLDVRVTLGGLFWFVGARETDPVRRLIRFGAGAGEAQGIYYFGGKADPVAQTQIGLFPVKYSPSHNLGEYLYRSGTYPGTLTTGGWSYMNAAGYLAQGIRTTIPTFDGKLTHDFTLFMERDLTPLNDFSPGYNLTAKPTPYLELGGGVVWSHAISLSPSRLTPKAKGNAYSKTTNMPVFGADVLEPLFDSVGNFIGFGDTAAREAQTLQDWEQCQAGDCSNIGYYTFRGFKAAARAAVDVGTLVSPANIPAGTFRVYGEVALLGIEDQPFFYEKKTERMPVMAGIDIPTFGILDRLSAEVEYNKSRFRNNIFAVNQSQYPIPLSQPDISGGIGSGGYAYLGEEDTKDDLKWSFFASRKITEGLSIHAQAASDHMRHPDFWGVMSDESATREKTEWYYVFRADFGF